MCTLINRTAVKRFILEQAAIRRPGWPCNRVSAEALAEIEGHLRFRILGMLERHPTAGKTFKP